MTTTATRSTPRQLRQQAGLTMADIAQRTGLSSACIFKVETNFYGSVNAETASRIARAFNLSVEDVDWQMPVTTDGRTPLTGVPITTGPIRKVEVCTSCFTEKSFSGSCAC